MPFIPREKVSAAVHAQLCARFEKGKCVNFQGVLSCEPHREGKETCLCPTTDRARFDGFQIQFGLVVRMVWIGSEYGCTVSLPSSWVKARQKATRQTVLGQRPKPQVERVLSELNIGYAGLQGSIPDVVSVLA